MNHDDAALLEQLADQYVATMGGNPTGSSMALLDGNRLTLLAYVIFRREMLEGGMIQLIHNGYGPFIFENPFAKAMRLWGLKDFSKLVYSGRELYEKYGKELTADCTDEEFMALYEQYEAFDEIDDEFVEAEPQWTAAVAAYVGDHRNLF